MATLKERLFVSLQRITPRYLLTRFVHSIAQIRAVPLKNFLIRGFIRLYRPDLGDLARPVPDGFVSFNDFFTRELAAGARAIDSEPHAIVSPADGTVSAAGQLHADSVLQAKGIEYSLSDLLATDLPESERFYGGTFVTIYLAPWNYHRVHAPVAGRPVALRYVPGDLFSVNAATVRHLPGLFTRNERLVCHLETAGGPVALVLVGAMNVGTINTVWTGDLTPRAKGPVEQIDLAGPAALNKGETLGWFNMGSTVILVLPPGAGAGLETLREGEQVVVGQRIATVPA